LGVVAGVVGCDGAGDDFYGVGDEAVLHDGAYG
jgi:hypothetical protein